MFSIYKQSDAQTLTLDSCLTWRSPVKRKGVLKGKWSLLYFISLEENRKGGEDLKRAHNRMCGKSESRIWGHVGHNVAGISVTHWLPLSHPCTTGLACMFKKKGWVFSVLAITSVLMKHKIFIKVITITFIHHVFILMLLLFKDILIRMEIMTYGNKPNMHTIVLLRLRS